MTASVSKPLYSRQFIVIGIANFFSVLGLSTFFLFPLFITARGGNKTDIGILMGAMTLSSVLLRPLVSQMVDRLGRKRCYFMGTLVNTVVPAVHVLFRGSLYGFYAPLIGVRMIHGMGIALCLTAVITYVADIVPEERRNEGLGMFGVTAMVAMAAGPSLSEPIIRNFGFNSYFLAVSSMGFIAMLLQFLIPETYVPDPAGHRNVSFLHVLRRGKALSVALLSLLFGFGLAAQSNYIAPYVEHVGLANISQFYIAYSAAAVVTRILGSRVADRIGEASIIPWAFAVSGFGYLFLVMVSTNWQLMVSGLMAGCGHGLVFPCLNALVLRNEPAHMRGKISGIFTGSIDGGLFLGSVALGYIGEWYGFTPLFVTTFLVLIGGTGIFLATAKAGILVGTR